MRMIVIYTADIERSQTRARMDIGCLQFQLEEAFLRELDVESVERNIKRKLECKEPLTQEEQMQFIMLPLAQVGVEEIARKLFEKGETLEEVSDIASSLTLDELFELSEEVKKEQK